MLLGGKKVKRKYLIAAITLLTLQFVLGGCLAPTLGLRGSRSEVNDKKMLSKVSRVCLFPVKSSTDTTGKGRVLKKVKFIPTSDDSATNQLWRELDSRHLFRLIPLDTLKWAMQQATSSDSISYGSIARLISADAFLRPRLKYFWNGVWDIPAAEMYIAVVSPLDGKVIASAGHDTFAGNNYLLQSPDIETVRADAITGSVDAIVNAVNEAKQP